MTNMKPTAREVKVILNSIGLKEPNHIFNDKRVNGGRIKMWGFLMDFGDMHKLQVLLDALFPHLQINVERFSNSRGFGDSLWDTSTVVKWNNK